ncbi:MAG TPA: bifunctional 2-C-methyl-D-erythritol 4-phosphate cytidylyltransferase/2-C-methyl-D-erythritol 2,4-cyclodiphosphate synthase [Allosphingosinicella sp.]|jgi:2-C-methyl-D-erythritol 4-phosphate cytidylyltransferase/2-C-methyl-D-erythritol 2,4-cyclodiphosphate synthase
MGRTVVLLVAAGSGSRTGGDLPKQYRAIAGKALLAHAIDHARHSAIDTVQVVIGEGQKAAYAAAVGDRPLPPPVIGGATRLESVRNGLEALAKAGDVARVFIHDAARPFVYLEIWDRLIHALEDAEAAVPALPAVDTMARGHGTLGDTVSRDGLIRVQTPQAFRFEAILRAHRAWGSEDATDDAQVARAAGIEVALVTGDPRLEKLTYEEDFARAEAAFAVRLVSRTGMGFDVHAFARGEELWLGGIIIPHDRGLKGHSDADVVLHALTDAILGAIAGGDIGDHFLPSDPQWRGASSSVFLEHARALVEAKGGRIEHVDVTIICEAPRIGPYRDAMRERIAGLLRLPLERTSIKATTTERLGFTGRGEGIAAQAVATVRLAEEI